MGGILGVSTPGGESNAVCVTGDFQTRKGAIGIFFAFDRTYHHAIPAVIGGNTRIKPFKGQLRAHRFRLLRTFERTALYHPATFVFFLRRLLRRFGLFRDRRGLLRFRLLRSGMRWRLEQILIRLSRLLLLLRFRLLLDRLRLHRTRRLLIRLFRYPRLCLRLLYRLGLRPLLLLLNLLLCLATLQRLLTLFRRLLIPRHFVQLRRLLAHIGLHLCQQLTLFIRQLIRILHFTTRRRFRWRTYPRLTAFQLFDIAPALFRLRREAISGDFTGLKRLRLFFFMVRDKVQATNKGDDYSRSNSDHCWRDSRQVTLLFP